MSDIKEQLQQLALSDIDNYDDRELIFQAVDTIKRLEAELEKHQWRTDMENAPKADICNPVLLRVDCCAEFSSNMFYECGPHDAPAYYWENDAGVGLWRSTIYADFFYPNPTHWKPLDKPE